MILFRQVDGRHPFLWEGVKQPAGRWHAAGDGPVHYYSDTPDGAWAEFLRHEEITDPEDLPTIRRQMWVVDVGDAAAVSVDLPLSVLTGGIETYAECQQRGVALRGKGVQCLGVPSAALKPGQARGMFVDRGLELAPAKTGIVVVFFGETPRHIGWVAAVDARPPADLLDRVHHYADGPPRTVRFTRPG